MALNVKPEVQLVFFEKTFGTAHAVTGPVKNLISKGVQFEVTLYTIKATYKGKLFQQALSKGTTTLMNEGPYSYDTATVANKKSIQMWINALCLEIGETPIETPYVSSLCSVRLLEIANTSSGLIPIIKAVMELTKLGLKEVSDLVKGPKPVTVVSCIEYFAAVAAFDKLKEVGAIVNIVDDKGGVVKSSQSSSLYPLNKSIPDNWTKVVKVEEVKIPFAKPNPSVIVLREAQALNQKVKGTSSESVYYCVAFNSRVKLAARIIKGGTVSLRAEWKTATNDELIKLEQGGLEMKTDYASMHINIGEVPVGRIIGAFLLGLGIKFDEQITSIDQLILS